MYVHVLSIFVLCMRFCCILFVYCFKRVFCWYIFLVFFFFKQKTAYEMRISDWSSDVCSSDLRADLLLVSQYGFEFALIGGHGGLAHAMASLTSDAMSKSQAFPGRVSFRSFMVSFSALSGSSASAPTTRSEEHTSELQSLMRTSYAVFCLIKKKRKDIDNKSIHESKSSQ